MHDGLTFTLNEAILRHAGQAAQSSRDYSRLVAVQKARRKQTQILYQSTVLNSLEETENALVNYSQEQERRDRLQAAVSQNQTALELSRELYTSGLGDFLAVLDAQRQLYGNEDLLAQSQTAVTTNLIALYKALGGGWESFPQQ